MSLAKFKARLRNQEEIDDSTLSLNNSANSHTSESSCQDQNVPRSPPSLPQFNRIKENVYLTEKSSTKEQKMRRMRCECLPSGEGEFGCIDGCFNRELFIECGPKCLYGDQCANKRFQTRENANVEPFFAGAKGFGLRACEDISSDTFIMEYVGEVLNKHQFDKRTRRYAKDSEHKHHYFMSLKSDTIIDATEKGSVSRFINHSCDPNCATQKWCVDGELRIGFFSIRSMQKGEELTFDYRFQRYGREAQECFCGASNCRGFIGEQATKEEMEECEENIKEEKLRKRRQREMVKDKQLEKELRDLTDQGKLRNQADVLKCSRIMVRTGDIDTQLAILKLIKNSDKPLLRVFLDYQGCQLLWIWTSANDYLRPQEQAKLNYEIVQVLQMLPIPHRNMLEDSKVLRTVERWANPDKEDSDDVEAAVESCLSRLVNNICAEEDTDSQSSQSSPSQNEEHQCTQLNKDIATLAQALLDQWLSLSKYFKIPKKSGAGGRPTQSRYCGTTSRESRFSSSTIRRSTLSAPVRSASNTLGAYYNKPKKPFYRYENTVPTVNLTNRSNSGPDLSDLIKPPPPPPVANKQRVSRFDRKTPPHLLQERTVVLAPKVLTKEERRRAFELAVKATERDQAISVKDSMSMDFEMAAAKFEAEDDKEFTIKSEPIVKIEPLDTLVKSEPMDLDARLAEIDPAVPSDYNPAEPNSPSDDSWSGIVPVPNQPDLSLTSTTGARPAILVSDRNTKSFWWQDQSTLSLVFQVQPKQAAAIISNDWSLRPWFKFEAVKNLIHQVQVNQSEILKESSPTVSTSQDNLLPDDSYFGIPPGIPATEIIVLLKKQIMELRGRLRCSSNGETERPASAMSVSEDEEEDNEVKNNVPESTTNHNALPLPQSTSLHPPLPHNWKVAYDHEQNPYYYNTLTKETQWERPHVNEVICESPSKGPKTPTSSPSPKRRKAVRSSSGGRSAEAPVRVAADTSGIEMSQTEANKNREKFKSQISGLVVKSLAHYRKDGRFKTEADFKHLARKISHGIMEKELKMKPVEQLVVTDSTSSKAKHYIKNYMKKIPKVYSRCDKLNSSTLAESPLPQ